MSSALPGRAFWAGQFAHQAPMLGAMILMLTVLRSVLGMLAITAALWIVALGASRAARRSVRARELLLDVLAMGAVLVVPLLTASPGGMPGMPRMSVGQSDRAGGSGQLGQIGQLGQSGHPLELIVVALVVVVLWAVSRLLLARTPAARVHRLDSAVSGCCCAAGLLAMLVSW